MKLNNTYWLLRHGEAVSNVKSICSSWPEQFENPLTEYGVEMIKESAEKLVGKHVELIVASDLLRTKQTAQIVADRLNVEVKFDTRLREISFGIFNGKTVDEFEGYFKNHHGEKDKAPEGENYEELQVRIFEGFQEIDNTYEGKTILIVSHQAPLLLLYGKVKGYTIAESISNIDIIFTEKRIHKGELVELN